MKNVSKTDKSHVGVSKRFSRSIGLAVYCLYTFILADHSSCRSYVGSVYQAYAVPCSLPLQFVTQLSLCAGYLVVLSEDVSLNPGPANGLDDVVKLRGLKFIHQNIQSLGDIIDQLPLLLQELHSGIQIITLSENWIKIVFFLILHMRCYDA